MERKHANNAICINPAKIIYEHIIKLVEDEVKHASGVDGGAIIYLIDDDGFFDQTIVGISNALEIYAKRDGFEYKFHYDFSNKKESIELRWQRNQR